MTLAERTMAGIKQRRQTGREQAEKEWPALHKELLRAADYGEWSCRWNTEVFLTGTTLTGYVDRVKELAASLNVTVTLDYPTGQLKLNWRNDD